MVVLQFCLNDYTGTPLLFENEGRVIKVLHHRSEEWSRSSWLFGRSGLYRLLTYQSQAQRAKLEETFAPVEAALDTDFARSGQKGRIEFGAPRKEKIVVSGEANKRQRQHQRNRLSPQAEEPASENNLCL